MSYITAQSIAQFCDDFLQAKAFSDYCPNGLQIDAKEPIKKIITGVTASMSLIDAAIEQQANALLVHHGYFWKGESPSLVGMKGDRVRKLMQHGISLLAYHLPLDAHTKIGNNAILAQDLDLQIVAALYPQEKYPIGNIATCQPISGVELAKKIQQKLGRTPLHIQGIDRQITKVGICTGAAQDMIEQAALMGCDAFISGEISERTTHFAKELGIDYFAAGHHATERGGIEQLGNIVSKQFQIPVNFVDIDNPV